MSNVEDRKSRPMPDPKLAEFVVVGRRHHNVLYQPLTDAASRSASESTLRRNKFNEAKDIAAHG